MSSSPACGLRTLCTFCFSSGEPSVSSFCWTQAPQKWHRIIKTSHPSPPPSMQPRIPFLSEYICPIAKYHYKGGHMCKSTGQVSQRWSLNLWSETRLHRNMSPTLALPSALVTPTNPTVHPPHIWSCSVTRLRPSEISGTPFPQQRAMRWISLQFPLALGLLLRSTL